MRQFLISRESLSVRMLDEAQDPTPLLKEIRDDKVTTIIIDASAAVSHLVLSKVQGGGSDRGVERLGGPGHGFGGLGPLG